MERTATVLEVDGNVEVSLVRLHVPLPPGCGAPADCDWLTHLRYRPVDGPEDPQVADAVLSAQPGGLGAAPSMDPLARATVRAAREQGLRIEVWSHNRRCNGLEDRTGVHAARQSGDYRRAFAYYYDGAPIDGKRFDGWKRNGQLRCLDTIGSLPQSIRDWDAELRFLLPEPEVRRTRLFLGGHSMGGFLAGIYGAWDFHGERGADNCAGFFALDTLITVDPVHLRQTPVVREVVAAVSRAGYALSKTLFRRGVLPRTMRGAPIADPHVFTLLGAIGVAVLNEGDVESEIGRLIPARGAFARTLRVLTAPTWYAFLRGRPTIRDFCVTNEALLGMLLDGNSLGPAAMAINMGTVDSERVRPKTFPARPGVVRLPVVGRHLRGFLLPRARYALTDPDHLYRWRNYNAVDAPGGPVRADGTPYATPAEERVDITELALILSGPLGMMEAYSPVRIVTDIFFAFTGTRTGELAAMRHEEAVTGKPIITVLGGDSPLKAVLDATRLMPTGEVHVIPGAQHVDLCLGAAVQNDGRPEPASAALAQWVAERVQGLPGYPPEELAAG